MLGILADFRQHEQEKSSKANRTLADFRQHEQEKSSNAN